MTKRTAICLATVLAAACVSVADVTGVGRIKRRYVVTSGTELVTVCPVRTALPGEVAPAFWFDAGNRIGWEMSGSCVNKIPSLVGDGRYLTTNENSFVQWKCWRDGSLPRGAELNLNEENDGIIGPYLDFGEVGSRSGLLFDADGVTGSNGVYEIKTVISVFESSRGGGYFLGGGWGVPNKVSNPTAMLDGRSFVRTTKPYSEPFGSTGLSSTIFTQYGALLHDALWPSAPMLTGFNGGWEVVAWRTYDDGHPANASGVGVGNLANGSNGEESGGHSIAELLIYTNILTDAQCEAVSAYLRNKWFGEPVPGYDGLAEAGVLRISHSGVSGAVKNSRTLDAVYAAVTVGSGERFEVDRITGGYHGGSFTKKGQGVMAVRSADTYSGTLAVAEGTLSFLQREIPSAPPSAGKVLHLDADAADTLTVRTSGDVTYLVEWTDCDGGVYGAEALDESCQPVLRYGDFANGKPCVDFGVLGSGRILDIVKANSVTAGVDRIMSVVYVIGAQEGGGTPFSSVGASFLGSYCFQLDRGSYTNLFNLQLWDSKNSDIVNQVCYGRGGSFSGAYYFNGEKDGYSNKSDSDSDNYFGYQTPGWQTVGANVYCGKLVSLGGTRWFKRPCTGGMRLAEVIVYDRPLSEEETRDASAYLAWKWFGKINAGYSAPSGAAVCAAQNVAVGAAATLDVAGGAVRIDALSTNAVGSVLTKTGAGSLEIVSADAAVLNIASGNVRAVAASEPASAASAAEGSSFWLDATDTAGQTVFSDADGIERLKVWGDKVDPRRAAYASTRAKSMPFINTVDTQNGLRMVDLGPYGSEGATLNFARPLDAIRSVFMVVRFDPAGAAPLLGFSMDDVLFGGWPPRASADFLRRKNSSMTNMSFVNPDLSYLSGVVEWGSIFTNGVQTTYKFEPADDCQLVEVHSSRGVYGSALGYDPSHASAADADCMCGGLRVGELIVYERALTEREKIATRNYLMKKWFAKSDDDLEPLPEAATPSVRFGEVNVSPGARFETSPGTVLDGSLSCAGGATLTVRLSADEDGRISADMLRVGGAVTFEGVPSVVIETGLSVDDLAGARIKVVSADGIEGAEYVRTADIPAPYSDLLGLRVRNGNVYLVDVTRGAVMIVR